MPQHSITKYIPADYNVICDVCGKKRKRSFCDMAYGSGTEPVVMSCGDGCADYNHPLNYPPPIIFDGRPVPDARPDQKLTFVNQGPVFSQFMIGHFPGQTIGHFPYTASAPNADFDLIPLSSIGNLIWS